MDASFPTGSVLQTDRLVCSQDALPWRNYPERCLLELPLLRLGERGDLVRHADRPAAFGCTVGDSFTLKNLLFCMQLKTKYSKYKRLKFLELQPIRVVSLSFRN